jgi:hypothetical protein
MSYIYISSTVRIKNTAEFIITQCFSPATAREKKIFIYIVRAIFIPYMCVLLLYIFSQNCQCFLCSLADLFAYMYVCTFEPKRTVLPD